MPSSEVLNGARIWRVRTTRFGRQGLVGRGFDYVTFYLSAGWHLARRVRRGDIVVAKTDPPLISVIAALVARWRGAALVNWLQDLFPEVASALGVSALRPFGPVLARLRNASLRTARRNVVLGARMAQKVAALGVAPARIVTIHNWSDGQEVRPVGRHENPLRREWGLADRFVVGYSGNMGRAHEFATIIDAAVRLRDDEEIRFLFIGGGAQAERIAGEAAQRRLDNILFRPYQPREALALSLGVSDVHLVSLQPALEGLIVPSKFYGIAAAGRPTLFVGDPEGEIAAILKKGECGHAVCPGDADALARLIRILAADRASAERLGRNARAMFERDFSKSIALSKWDDVLSGAG